ncbi:unnamed protein product [Coregonus sp. 'balchen']|nr:unnamed protein product [Coregonus sp. 'balchen']
MDVNLLKSINERLAKLDISDILREDINALCASLEFSQCQIDDLRKENTELKDTCRSKQDNLIFSGILENDNSRGCEDTVRDFDVNSTETAHRCSA